jgi:hypothetical protein
MNRLRGSLFTLLSLMIVPNKLVARDAFISRVTRYINYFCYDAFENLFWGLEAHDYGQ